MFAFATEKKNEMENEMEKIENNGENSGPLTSLPVDRLTATDCNAATRANFIKVSHFVVKYSNLNPLSKGPGIHPPS